MNKIILLAACFFTLQAVRSQTLPSTSATDSASNAAMTTPAKKAPIKIDLSNRANDHLMFQFGYDGLSGTNDTISPSGFSRFFNAYIMLDKPFRNSPKMSVGFGLGLGSSNLFFKNTYVDVKSTGSRLPFTPVDSTNHFKKFKLTTIFLEAPVELRYSSNPLHSNSAFKAALGFKIGTMLKAYTKGKTLVDKNGNTINSYVEKESSKRFFNTTRLAVTARFGYGIFGIYGAYQVTSFIKDVAGPSEVRPYSIGIYISGL